MQAEPRQRGPRAKVLPQLQPSAAQRMAAMAQHAALATALPTLKQHHSGQGQSDTNAQADGDHTELNGHRTPQEG